MFRTTILITLLLFVCAADARAEWVAQVSGTTVRLRGVSAVNGRVAWASGANGTYARTTDGGRTWRAGQVPGAAELDFRDVDAFDADTAYLLAIGEGERSRIYKTTDGGRNWTLQFQNTRARAFYDCMAFWDERNGIAISDPVEGHFLVLMTDDGGRRWHQMSTAGMPPAFGGEGGFAASGTCVVVRGTRTAWFGTGGPAGARVFRSDDGGRTWSVADAPFVRGSAAGIFSLDFYGDAGAAVGGDYTKERGVSGNAALSYDGGRSWWALESSSRPGGYRSCVAYVPGTGGRKLIAVGPSGSDYSTNSGRTWKSLGEEGFHALSVARRGDVAWAVGENGRVARLERPSRLGRATKRYRER
ncbi:MAG: oxidoreductase [Pyrinomonadaceae bacterium]